MDNNNVVANVVDGILTAILQWRVEWLEQQKVNSLPPPICRSESKKLKITYDGYKDYESTFVPLIMHEIWAQIYEETVKLENELNGLTPMDIDQSSPTDYEPARYHPNGKHLRQTTKPPTISRQFWVGIDGIRSEGQYQMLLKCQYVVEASKVSAHLKVIGEGDLVRLDLSVSDEPQPVPGNDIKTDPVQKVNILNLFAYVNDVTTEKVHNHSHMADCINKPPRNKLYYLITYHIIIAKRALKLKMSDPARMSGLYYLKPMIRQIESVANLRESSLASDILSPKAITCQLTIPTVVAIKSPHYNDTQFKAIVGTNEALVRNIPKIQLIQGPPGTGKTHTLIGIIKHFYKNWIDVANMPKILICAPSNGAIDEVARRLQKEREFLRNGPPRRSLRIVRVGHPDHISETVKHLSLEELVERNSLHKVEELKKKHSIRLKSLEDELSQCDVEISNLRYSQRAKEIPGIEMKISSLLKQLENLKQSEEVNTKREFSDAAKRNMKYELIKNADVILTTLNSCQRHPLDVLFRGEKSDLSFHCVIVDEASQCCEPELLMPLCYKISKMILIGDPMQLPATVISQHAQSFGYGRSLFERFFLHFGEYSKESPVAMLTEQYRMHPDICLFPSVKFYDSRLISSRPIERNYPIKPYIMFDLRHSKENKSDKMSIENEVEADFVRTLLIAVLQRAPKGSKIGVITPYRGQKRLITNKISSLQTEKQMTIDVNTCDGFQGQEKDIILLSCVRAFDGKNPKSTVGFLKSFQRVNVALTRARNTLIVCVSAKSLSNDETWKALIDDATDRRFLQTLTQTPSPNLLANLISNTQSGSVSGAGGAHKRVERSFRPADIVAENESQLYDMPIAIPMDID